MKTFHLPGERLLSILAPTEALNRSAEFCAATGLEPADLVISPLVSTPMPNYATVNAEGRRRWSGTTVEAMRHPLMWLPARVAGRYRLPTGRLETDGEWAARVAVECEGVGLYDSESGEWVDVLFEFCDIDITTEHGSRRVARWLDGEDDEVLDSLELAMDADVHISPEVAARLTSGGMDLEDPATVGRISSWLAGASDVELSALGSREEIAEGFLDERDWAFQQVSKDIYNLAYLVWYSWGHQLSSMASDIADAAESGELGFDEQESEAFLIRQLANLAMSPDHIVSPEGALDYDNTWCPRWDAVAEDPDTTYVDILREMSKGLASVSDYYWPMVEEITSKAVAERD